MPIPTLYRPGIATTTTARVEVDGWAAGQLNPGVIDTQGTLWLLQNLEGWHAGPSPRTSFTPRPATHGWLDPGAFLDGRTLVLDGKALAVDLPSARLARDILASVCGDPSLSATLVVTEPGQPTRQMVVRRAGETKTKPTGPSTFVWSMVLAAPDPRRYANIASTQFVPLPGASVGGLVFPLVFPLTFGSGAGAGGQMTLTNNGTLTTPIVWEIRAPVTTPVITNMSTGARLEFRAGFSIDVGQPPVIIDTDARTVLQGGVNRRADLVVPQWFALEPGPTTVRFSGASSDPATARLTATWRDAWT